MRERNRRFPIFFIWLVLFSLFLFCFPVMSQDDISYGPITGIDLGVSSLDLKVGESYTFRVAFEPENTVFTTLDWYVTDESVIRVDPLTDTVTALADGEARIFAESFDQFSYAVCTVTVGDSVSKDAAAMKSGSEFMGLSREDAAKISAESLLRYMDFVSDSTLGEAAYETVSARLFDVIAAVRPGTEDAQRLRAKACGMEDSEALKKLNAVTLAGSLDAILEYVKDNKDLREIFEFGPFAIEEPIEEEVSSESIQKTVGLRGSTQELTNISYAQNKLGLTGKGRWIAVIDSGINYRNAQFSNGGRTIIEKCFSKPKRYNGFTLRSVCNDGSAGTGASAPGLAWRKNACNHGSHVTGIAAGRDGIAPLANIISIQSHTEKVWTCKDAKERQASSCGSGHYGQCCATYISNSDLARAYDYLIDLSKTYKIDAVNMSYGVSKKYTGICDSQVKWEKNYFDKMTAAGMLPVVSSGNDGYNGGVQSAACLSNAYAVGALIDQSTPRLRNSSNHSGKVDITAPGTNIYSAGYSESMMVKSGTSMSAPMVTGAVALIKQMYPGMTFEDAGKFLKTISEKTVKTRANGRSFQYTKPVLTFGKMHKLVVPYYSWIVGGDHSITFKVYRMARQVNFSAEVTTLSGQKVPGIKVQWKNDGIYTYIRVFGNSLQNGTIYKVKLTRTFNVGKTNFWAYTTEYGRPTASGQIPQVSPENNGVTLKTGTGGGVRYYIYDQASKKLVKQENAPSGSQPFRISGLVNGRIYAVSAAPYQKITITKNGIKKEIPFYGAESSKKIFIPMSAPFNGVISYPVFERTTAIVSCTADSGVSGIKIWYRKADDTAGNWTLGCTTSNGEFSCKVQNTGRGYDFRIQKYKKLGSMTFDGPAVVVRGR